MSRTTPLRKLNHCPLVLVLCQVKFSPIMTMDDSIPKIQERLRAVGYKVNASKRIQSVAVTRDNTPKPSIKEHWEFQNAERTASVVVNEGFVVFQTTAYDTFETFLPKIQEAASIVSKEVNGVFMERVGLRYINLIRPQVGKSWKSYIREGLRGIESPYLLANSTEDLHQTTGLTEVGNLILRIWQNRQGQALPPDLLFHQLLVPENARNIGQDESIALIDMDHIQERLVEDYSNERLSQIGWALKNGLYDIFTSHVVTPEALEAWR